MIRSWIVRSVFSFLFFLVLVFGLAFPLLALDFPRPTGYVNDFAGIFSGQFKTSLEEDLVAFEKETTIEIAVVTVGDLQETTIEDFAVHLFEDWQIGKKEKDNGLLLLIAPNQRELRIEVGYGLESIITDSRAGRIIRNEITPEFKKGNYEQGVKNGCQSVKDYVESGEAPAVTEGVKKETKNNFSLVIIGFFVLVYLSSFWGRSKRIWPGGVVGAFLGLIVNLLIGVFTWAIVFGLFGLLLDWLLSKNYKKLKKAGKSTGWWRSGGGFSGGGGGGFGGFGGGSSGGGGASGSW